MCVCVCVCVCVQVAWMGSFEFLNCLLTMLERFLRFFKDCLAAWDTVAPSRGHCRFSWKMLPRHLYSDIFCPLLLIEIPNWSSWIKPTSNYLFSSFLSFSLSSCSDGSRFNGPSFSRTFTYTDAIIVFCWFSIRRPCRFMTIIWFSFDCFLFRRCVLVFFFLSFFLCHWLPLGGAEAVGKFIIKSAGSSWCESVNF